VKAAQDLMRRHDVKLLVAVCTGAPRYNGFLRYFTGAEMWGGREFLVLRPDTLERYVVIRSTYDAEWLRVSAINTRVDSTLLQFLPPVRRFIQVLGDLTGGSGRIGMLNARYLTNPEAAAIREALPKIEIVDLTVEANALRQAKSPYEIDAVRRTALTLAEGMAMFREGARPGRRIAELAGEVDGFLKGRGCFWGRVTCALNDQPYAVLPPTDRVLTPDDVVLFRLTHNGPEGYWCDVARVFSFKELSPDAARRLRAAEAAMRAGAALLAPGGTSKQASAAINAALEKAGLSAAGRGNEDCQTVGTDEDDGGYAGRDGRQPELEFRENMVVTLHPAVTPSGGAFALCDTFLVRPGGGESVSPAGVFHTRIDA
jgi:Xaa-Pro aminopeptidase